MNNKQIILGFIKRQKLAVISTVGVDNKPESAVLEFSETDELELVFDTFTTSRKYKNLLSNKNVSFVIGWDEDITVQYEGEVHQLSSDELEKYQKICLAKNPAFAKWMQTEGIKFFKVIPKWIRYSDLNKEPWEVFEINL